MRQVSKSRNTILKMRYMSVVLVISSLPNTTNAQVVGQGTICANVVSDVATIGQDPSTGVVTVSGNDNIYMNCEATPDSYVCNF